jgi:transketolase
MSREQLDQLCIDTIRFLSIDSVEKAKSGHPGAPMGAAAMTYILWNEYLNHNPSNPTWPDRDRFILSPGHASALLYSMLHLTGYSLTINDLKEFRQLNSKTPGHPEYGITPGVELTTGPLGQGFANGVGMAIAESKLAADFNKNNNNIINHFTYGIVSDGDLQEGVASEAASLAGTLKLGKLIYLYDSNDISIEGSTSLSFTEDVKSRFSSYGWQVIGPIDGLNLNEIRQSLELSQSNNMQPSLIICKTTIGYGSPNKSGKASAHGEPLGESEVMLTKQQLNWQFTEPFCVPDDVLKHMKVSEVRGAELEKTWEHQLNAYKEVYPTEFNSLNQQLTNALPNNWDQHLDSLFNSESNAMATRESSGIIMNAMSGNLKSLIGGSADLGPSNKTNLNDWPEYSATCRNGRNFHFGVREHAMGAIANGMSLHGGIIPFTATFLVFSDYMKPSIRLASLMGLRVIFIFTHDSIGLGEDGPTHQPIEHLVSLRAIPNLTVIRPADSIETVSAWRSAISKTDGPTALVLSRQSLPNITRNNPSAETTKGAYIVNMPETDPDVTLIASGSEVQLAIDCAQSLNKLDIKANIVSMSSWEIYDSQSQEYKDSVLRPSCKLNISIEAGLTLGWNKYVGDNGITIGIDTFGASGPATDLFEHFGFTSKLITEQILSNIKP